MPRASFGITEVEVAGSRDNTYYVVITGGIPTSCNCPNFEHRAGPAGTMCKHMRARSGRKAVGVTSCVHCRAWLTPTEIKDQPEPEASDPSHGDPLQRMCSACSSVR